MSKEINTGGPAYPTIANVEYAQNWDTEEGMTLRDYFAGQALAGIINSTQDFVFKTLMENGNHGELKIQLEKMIFDTPKDSYRIADAMIKEREK